MSDYSKSIKIIRANKFPAGSLHWRSDELKKRAKNILAAIGHLPFKISLSPSKSGDLTYDNDFVEFLKCYLDSYAKTDELSLKHINEWISKYDVSGDVLNLCIDKISNHLALALESKLITDVSKRTTFRELLERRKMMKMIGLRGKGIVTEELANRYFSKYGTSYSDLIIFFDNENLHVIMWHLLLSKNYEGYVLFPLTGQLFTYYFASGVHEEMQRDGMGKKLKLRTIKSFGYILDGKFKGYNQEETADDFRLMENYMYDQVSTIIKDRPSFISMIDYSVEGRTRDSISHALAKMNLRLADTANITFDGHNEYTQKGLKLFGMDIRKGFEGHPLYNKRRPIVLRYDGISELNDSIFRNKAYVFGEQAANNKLHIGKIKEILVTFGRVYYHINKSSFIDEL